MSMGAPGVAGNSLIPDLASRTAAKSTSVVAFDMISGSDSGVIGRSERGT